MVSYALLAVALPVLLAADAGAGSAAGSTSTDTRPTPPLIAPPGPRGIGEAQRIELKDAKDGSGDLVYENSNFTARIAPDGSVSFADKRISGATPFGFWPMDARMGVPSLQSSLKMLLKGRGPPQPPPSELDEGLAPPETKQLIPDVSRYRPDPREGSRIGASGQPGAPFITDVAVPVQGFGRFDLTDELTRFAGKDPHRYQKATFLAATHDRRIQMAVNMHAKNIRRASAELPARLQAIACDPRLTYKERRAILVALAREMDTQVPEGAGAAKAIGSFLKRFDSGEVTCAAAGKATPN